jgi:hypothetical protein
MQGLLVNRSIGVIGMIFNDFQGLAKIMQYELERRLVLWQILMMLG